MIEEVLEKAVEPVRGAVEILQDEEGFSETPYIDPLAHRRVPPVFMQHIIKYWPVLKPTFGYGFTNITKEEGLAILVIRTENNYKELYSEIRGFEAFPPAVQTVLVCMAHQLGIEGVLGFRRTLDYMRNGEWEKAAEEMLDSHWARFQTPRRAERMANIIRSLA